MHGRVFTAASTQDDVFQREGTLATERVMAGLHATVLAYGTAGSGKTHTLLGPRENPGVGPLCVASLFKMMQDVPSTEPAQPQMHFSCCELYQNQVFDLLVSKQHQVSFNGKHDLASASMLFTKVGLNSMEHFWEVLARLREVSPNSTHTPSPTPSLSEDRLFVISSHVG
jgi:hypothetical protein